MGITTILDTFPNKNMSEYVLPFGHLFVVVA